MNQPFYIVHGFERTQSFIEDQHTVDVTILVVDIGGKDASIVSIRSTPYCISQNNIVTLHGGIIFLILRQEYEV